MGYPVILISFLNLRDNFAKLSTLSRPVGVAMTALLRRHGEPAENAEALGLGHLYDNGLTRPEIDARQGCDVDLVRHQDDNA